eukprot:GFUD01032247.1.p1 GENE.GFUD01032247.1~~GFUD01032247.1.p1  ORF type:complete len:490 (+),score=136.31 GFUD01032247.1:92-1561(+)
MSSTMMNFMHMRNSKKAYAVYAVGLFVVFSIGLVIKNFNDKISLMTDSVHSYQKMIDKQTEQMKAISMEKERYKRDLKEEKEVNAETIKEMETKVTKLEDECKQENAKLEAEMSDLQDIHNNLEEQNKKLENKYKTLSKANSAAIAEIESFKTENKKLRSQLHDASTSKASELMQLRDSMARISLERDKYNDQYTALFKQHQQSFDSIQLLQNEKDRLQEQIREIQRLSGSLGANKSSSPAPDVRQVQPDESQNESNDVMSSSSTARAPQVNQVMEEPGLPQNASSTSSAPQAFVGGPAAAQAPPPFQSAGPAPDAIPLQVQAAARVARYPAQPAKQVVKPVYPAVKKKVPQYYQANEKANLPYQAQFPHPIQPVHHQHQEDERDNEIDVLHAPQVKQINYAGQGLNNWYPGNDDRQYGQVRQVVPQVGKYGGVQPQLVRHGWGDQGGRVQRLPQQLGGLGSWQDNQNLGYGEDAGQNAYQRVNRGRDF